MNCDLSTSIPDWIIEHPETTIVFTELGLDVSCGGKSLEFVAISHGLDPGELLARLQREIANRGDETRQT